MQQQNILLTNETTVSEHVIARQRSHRKTRILSALIAAAMLVCTLGWSVALPKAARADSAAPQLEGAWHSRVGLGGGSSPFTALLTFNRGGTLQIVDATSLETPSATTGLGVWTKIGSNQYAFTWQAFLFDTGSAGFPASGSLKVRGVITLTGSDTYTSVSQFTIYNTAGNVVISGCTTGEAVRMIVEPLTDCPNERGDGLANTVSSGVTKSWKN